jgi:hypothetical protein
MMIIVQGDAGDATRKAIKTYPFLWTTSSFASCRRMMLREPSIVSNTLRGRLTQCAYHFDGVGECEVGRWRKR